MLAVCIRSIEVFLVLLIVTRCMGKREVASLQPFEFAFTMILANLATIPLGDVGIPIWEGTLPLIMMLLLQVTLSLFSLKSNRFQALVCGRPILVITHGIINEEALESLRYSIADLLAQIRSGSFRGPHEIEYAVLETNGTLNLFPKPQYAPVTRQDLNLPFQDDGLPYTLIEDGQLLGENLSALGRDSIWLEKQLRHYGCNSIRDALYALYLTDGSLAVQVRHRTPLIRRLRP